MECWITVESFGADCPSNWEEIADYINAIIREKRETVDAKLDAIRAHIYDPDVDMTESYRQITDIEYEFTEWCDNLWESFCNGGLDGAPDPIF